MMANGIRLPEDAFPEHPLLSYPMTWTFHDRLDNLNLSKRSRRCVRLNKDHVARVEAKIEFADGKVRTVRPLTIKSLREFVKVVEGLNVGPDMPMTDETITKMVQAASIILRQVDEELAKDPQAVEEAIDMDVFQKLLTVAMGNRLVDPNG
jgi:hypothetical protein